VYTTPAGSKRFAKKNDAWELASPVESRIDSFAIDAVGLDLRVPVGRLRSASFDARPGTYRFYCSIPGHAALGMRGTLTVR
jgi:hypothetical protein